MSEQIETPANEEQETQHRDVASHENGDGSLPPFPPRPEQGHSAGSDVASQYRAIQEAQMLHEQTIKQLREEVLYQKERIAEISETAVPAGRAPQLDAVFLRLSELERKIGQDAPDPLLNEIVHRLAALENSPNHKQPGKDSRVDDLVEQVDKLRRRVAEPAGDSRVDDVVLRIASLESANKRGNYAAEIEGLGRRLQQLRTELDESRRADLESFRQELSKLSESVRSLAESDAAGERFEAMERRLEAVSEASVEARMELENKLESALARLPEPADAELEAARWQALESRLEALEQRPEPATAEALTELNDSLGAAREQLDALREGVAEAASAQRVLDVEARLEEVSARLLNPEPDEETVALRERMVAIEDRLSGEEGLGARLSAIEELASRPPAAPEAWAEKVERLGERLDGFEDLIERVANLEEQDAEQSQAGLLELTARLRSLELKAEDLDDIGVRLGDLREEIAEFRDGGPVGELRTEFEALREQSAKDESEGMRLRIEGVGARLDALEDKLRGLDDLGEVRRRLTVLEMSSREADGGPSEDLIARMEALEARPATVAEPDSDVDERLEALNARVAEVESDRALPDGSERLEMFSARIDALGVELDQLRGGEAGGGSDPRVAALADRLEWLEKNVSEGPDADLDPLRMRLAALEQGAGGVGGGGDEAVRARMQEILSRLDALEASGPGGNGELQKERERWSQWARSTLEEIGELRRQVEDFHERPEAGGGPSGLDAEMVEALGLSISSGLSKGEVRSLRQQMYFIYFAVGTLLALAVLFLFMMLTK